MSNEDSGRDDPFSPPGEEGGSMCDQNGKKYEIVRTDTKVQSGIIHCMLCIKVHCIQCSTNLGVSMQFNITFVSVIVVMTRPWRGGVERNMVVRIFLLTCITHTCVVHVLHV